MPGKIKHFLWRACTNSLPTKTNLLRRKISSESLCHQCGKSDEDTKHALWDCEAIKQFWCVDFGWVNRFEAEQGNFLDLFDRMVSKSGKAELFAISARHIWVHRNKTRLKEQAVPLDKIRDTAKTYLELFYASRDSLCGCKPRNPARNRRWQPPKPGEYKLNSDGAMFNESQEAGIGIVVRNSASQVLASLAEKIRKPCTVEHLETLAASRAVIFAAELGLQQAHFKGDSELVIKALAFTDGTMSSSSFGHLARDIIIHVRVSLFLTLLGKEILLHMS